MTKNIGIYISLELSKYKEKYSRSLGWSNERIKNDVLNIPVNENDEIDFVYINKLLED